MPLKDKFWPWLLSCSITEPKGTPLVINFGSSTSLIRCMVGKWLMDNHVDNTNYNFMISHKEDGNLLVLPW